MKVGLRGAFQAKCWNPAHHMRTRAPSIKKFLWASWKLKVSPNETQDHEKTVDNDEESPEVEFSTGNRPTRRPGGAFLVGGVGKGYWEWRV